LNPFSTESSVINIQKNYFGGNFEISPEIFFEKSEQKKASPAANKKIKSLAHNETKK